jgi:DNA polymerase III alpha subunit
VPIFQEQAMKIAIEAARFSPAEANELRKAMATFRSRDHRPSGGQDGRPDDGARL